MLLPRVIAAALALRQTLDILPTDYCSPQCRELSSSSPDDVADDEPSVPFWKLLLIPRKAACLTNIKTFDTATSCVGTSPFIVNCGGCQQCVGSYAIQNGTVDRFSDIQSLLTAQISRCAGTNASVEVAAIVSQASRISQYIATATIIASVPTATPTPDDGKNAQNISPDL